MEEAFARGETDIYNQQNPPPQQQQQPPMMTAPGPTIGLTNSMRVDATGALIPTIGIDNGMMSMSMRNMRSLGQQQYNNPTMGMTMPNGQQQPMCPSFVDSNVLGMSTHSREGMMMNSFGGGFMIGGTCNSTITTHSTEDEDESSSDDSSSPDESKTQTSKKKKKKKKKCKKKKTSKKKRVRSNNSSDDDSSSGSDDCDESFAIPKKNESLFSIVDDDDDEIKIREEYEEELLRKEREAKMLRFEQTLSTRHLEKLERNHNETEDMLQKAQNKAERLQQEAKLTIAQIEAERQGVTNAFDDLEEEHDEMVVRLAELEEENARHKKSKKKKKKKRRSRSFEHNLILDDDHVDDEDLDSRRPRVRRTKSAEGKLMIHSGSLHSKTSSSSKNRKKRSKSKECKLLKHADGEEGPGINDGSHPGPHSSFRSLDGSTTGKSIKRRSRSAERQLNFSQKYEGDDSFQKHKMKGRLSSSERNFRLIDDDVFDDDTFDNRKKHKKRSKSAERKLLVDDGFDRPKLYSSKSCENVLGKKVGTISEWSRHSADLGRSSSHHRRSPHFDSTERFERRMLKRSVSEIGQRSDFGLGRSSSHHKRSNGVSKLGSKLERLGDLWEGGDQHTLNRSRRISRSQSVSRSKSKRSRSREGISLC